MIEGVKQSSAYLNATLLMGRIVPRGQTIMAGLHASFADLHRLAEHLRIEHESGFMAALQPNGQPASMALIYEGKIIAASAEVRTASLWGQAALVEFTQQYSEGAPVEMQRLPAEIIFALSGLAEKPWRVNPGEGFSGVRAMGQSDVSLLIDGKERMVIDAKYGELGVFPAAQRTTSLTLPKVIGPWAHHRYALTLRGRDAINPITDPHARLRATHGKLAMDVLMRLGRGQTPIEAANSLDKEVSQLEPMVEAFLGEGLLQRRPDPI